MSVAIQNDTSMMNHVDCVNELDLHVKKAINKAWFQTISLEYPKIVLLALSIENIRMADYGDFRFSPS